MTLQDDSDLTTDPSTEQDGSETRTMRERVKEAVDRRDADGLIALLDPMPLSAAMRQLFALGAEDRDILLSLVPAEFAAELHEEAPHSAATELVDRMEPTRAAEVLEELDSDLKADLIGDLDAEDAEAILTQLDPEEAADVRRLIEYDDDTAGGLTVAEAFSFPNTATVGAVLRGLVTEDDDFERYRGQHPYVIDPENRPVGVVSLRGLLTAKRSQRLVEIMVTSLTAHVSTTLDELRDLFDEHNFLGLPVIETDGRLVGVVFRTAVDEAALERLEAESMKPAGLSGRRVARHAAVAQIAAEARMAVGEHRAQHNRRERDLGIRRDAGGSDRHRGLSPHGFGHVGLLGQPGGRRHDA